MLSCKFYLLANANYIFPSQSHLRKLLTEPAVIVNTINKHRRVSLWRHSDVTTLRALMAELFNSTTKIGNRVLALFVVSKLLLKVLQEN